MAITASALPAPQPPTFDPPFSQGPFPSAATQRLNFFQLQQSLQHIPEAHDAERPRPYIPRNPFGTHQSFPALPAPSLDSAATFEKLDIDTLFFIFYYHQGTHQQYLAAKTLKRHAWRFHKKYSTWFQRHEEPKVATEEYEQGTYVYFDYETGWVQRIKIDFRFDYAYLEDDFQ